VTRGDAAHDSETQHNNAHSDASASVGGALDGWFNRDLNDDGEINIDDYTIIDSNVAMQGSPFATAGGAASSASTSSRVAAVPEASSVMAVSLAAVAVSAAGARERRHTRAATDKRRRTITGANGELSLASTAAGG
jgi:hypothetical protein